MNQKGAIAPFLIIGLLLAAIFVTTQLVDIPQILRSRADALPQPTNLSYTCPADNNTATLSWATVEGASRYKVMVDNRRDAWQGCNELVEDDFHRADSTTSLGNALTGQQWEVFEGTWGINDNKAYYDYPNGTVETLTNIGAVVDAGESDAVVSVRLLGSTVNRLTESAQDGRVIFRYQDPENYHYVERRANENRDGQGRFYEMGKMVDGERVKTSDVWVSVNIGTGNIDPVIGELVKVELVGPSVKVFTDGFLVKEYNDASFQTATKFGIGSYNSKRVRFDDFVVLRDTNESTNTNGLDSCKEVLVPANSEIVFAQTINTDDYYQFWVKAFGANGESADSEKKDVKCPVPTEGEATTPQASLTGRSTARTGETLTYNVSAVGFSGVAQSRIWIAKDSLSPEEGRDASRPVFRVTGNDIANFNENNFNCGNLEAVLGRCNWYKLADVTLNARAAAEVDSYNGIVKVLAPGNYVLIIDVLPTGENARRNVCSNNPLEEYPVTTGGVTFHSCGSEPVYLHVESSSGGGGGSGGG